MHTVSLRRTALALAPLALLIALAGCSSDRDVLIRIGHRTVTVDDFKAAARGNETQYLGTPDQAKAILFDDLLRRELLLREADDRGLFKDSNVVAMRDFAERQSLRRAVLNQLAPRSIGVSDDEVKQMIAWQDTATHMLVIFVATQAVAQAAMAELAKGTPFMQVADRFNPTGVLPLGGDLGFGTPGSLVAPLDDLLRTSPVGKVAGPIESPGNGWFIIEVVARERRPLPAVAGRDMMLREQLRQRKLRHQALETYTALQREYHVERDPDAAAVLYQRIHPPASDQLKGMGADVPVEPGSPKDPTRVLARYQDEHGRPHTYTMGDAVEDWEHTQQAPDPSNTIALQYWVTEQCMDRVLMIEARRRHLDEDPALVRQLQQAVNNNVLQAIYQSDVLGEADLLPGSIEDYYETVKDNFQRLESVTLEMATLQDSAAAEMMAMHGGHAKDLAAALAMVHQSAPVTTRTVDYPTKDPMWQPLETTFLMVPAGEMGGPVRVADGWLIYRMVSKRQSEIPLAQLNASQRQLVQSRFDEQRRDQALHRVTDHLMKQYAPELHPELLKRIPWPIDQRSSDAG